MTRIPKDKPIPSVWSGREMLGGISATKTTGNVISETQKKIAKYLEGSRWTRPVKHLKGDDSLKGITIHLLHRKKPRR